jgi:RNA-binding protein
MFELRCPIPCSTEREAKFVLTPKMKRRIETVIYTEKPTLHIGKEGVTKQIINEVVKQLDAREIIKVKILKTALQENETKNIAEGIAYRTDSEIVDVRGHTFLLFKPKSN